MIVVDGVNMDGLMDEIMDGNALSCIASHTISSTHERRELTCEVRGDRGGDHRGKSRRGRLAND